MAKHVRIQKTRVIQVKKDSSHTEQSSYWDDVHMRQGGQDGDTVREHPQANPDVFPETEIAAPSTPHLLMGEAIEHLQGRQREVYILAMREGKSLAEISEILGVAKGNIWKYKQRAVKFIRQYCKNAIDKGRV